MNYHILLTIDVEDWFQVENFKQYIPFSSWPSRELRVEKNTHKILDLLDSQKSELARRQSGGVRSQSLPAVSLVGSEVNFNKPNKPLPREFHASESEADLTGASNSLRRRRIDLSQFRQETEKIKKSIKSCESCQKKTKTPLATFFVLGWIAERLPNLVREIHARGHEVASHGYYHNLCNHQSYEDLKTDLTDSKKLLEDIIGAPIYGYRAPSFAINEDILKVIEDCGYLYDSSYNSFSMHGRYGRLNLSQNGRKGIALQIPATRTPHPATHYQQPATSTQQRATSNQQPVPSNEQPATSNEQPATSNQYPATSTNHQSSILYELPISNLKFSPHGAEIRNLILPWGGGAYFRLIPFPLFKMGVQSILKKQGAYLFYFHPWEIDPQQPRVDNAPPFFKFRHYTNLDKTHSKLFRLIQSFEHCNFVTCSQYLSTISYELFDQQPK